MCVGAWEIWFCSRKRKTANDNVAQSCGSGLRQWGAIFLTTRYNTGLDWGPILRRRIWNRARLGGINGC